MRLLDKMFKRKRENERREEIAFQRSKKIMRSPEDNVKKGDSLEILMEILIRNPKEKVKGGWSQNKEGDLKQQVKGREEEWRKEKEKIIKRMKFSEKSYVGPLKVQRDRRENGGIEERMKIMEEMIERNVKIEKKQR